MSDVRSENALQIDEARRVGGGIEIAPPCGPAPARRITVARIAAACRALAIEDEIDGQAIRLSFEAHGSGGSISPVHDAPPSRREGRASGNLGRRLRWSGRVERLGERLLRSEASDWRPAW